MSGQQQPEASTSTSSPPSPSKHYVSLVIDSSLPRDQYSKLIEAEGVVHSLIQRLLEKHGGDKHLLFNSRVIQTQPRGTSTRPPVKNAGFRQSSPFLASLPAISRSLPASGNDTVSWPSFNESGQSLGLDLPWEAGKIIHRRRETCLLDGIVECVELLSHRPQRDGPRRLIHTKAPSEAAPLLKKTIRSSYPLPADSHYLIILSTSISTSTDDPSDEWRAVPTSNFDEEWDDSSWREVGEGCMANGIHASCVVAGREDDSLLSRSLRTLCQETSPNGFEEAWFDVPDDADVAISGFGIDPGTVPPSPSAQATSTAPTEQIITPATNPSETLPNITANANAAKAQLVQNQMMAFRAIQARAAEAGKPLNPQAMAQLMQAMKSGTLDINSPGLQQIKSLLSLQQQQRQGQVSMNPGAAAAAQVQAQTMSQGQGQGGGSNTDQLLMAAMRQQQMLQQQQNQSQAQVNMVQQNSQQQQSQQQQQQQRMQSQPQTQTSQQPTQSRGQHHLWSGNLIWNPNPSTKLILNLDANGVGGGQMADYKGDAWPKDLLITNVSQCAIQDLQVYSKANRTPFALFVPHNSPGGSDQGNLTRYTNMAKSLYAGGQMAVVNFGGDRGLVIFSMMTNGDARPERLMALVCINTPLPPMRQNQNSNTGSNHQRTQSQSQSQAQPQPQGQVFQNGQTSIHPGQMMNPSISPSNTFQAQPQQQQQQGQPFQNQNQNQNSNQFQQQQQYSQQQQQQQRPNGQQQFMLTPEQNQIFRHLTAQYNITMEYDPNNLDENKYRQIMSLVNSATEKRAQQQQQQQQQQQVSLDPQLDMSQMGNYQQQQQAFGQNGQNGFQGINMSGQGYQ